MQVSYVIVLVSDMERSVDFYRDVIGLPLRFHSPSWTEFATAGATLALHLSESPDGETEAKEEAPGRCRPGLRVPDLEAFHERLTAHGVRCVQPPTLTFGARIAQYVDPDGLVISVSEG